MSGATQFELDVGRLGQAVEIVLAHRRLTARAAAAEIGCSPSTLTRISHGQKPDADALVSILVWLQADAVLFTRPRVPAGATKGAPS